MYELYARVPFRQTLYPRKLTMRDLWTPPSRPSRGFRALRAETAPFFRSTASADAICFFTSSNDSSISI